MIDVQMLRYLEHRLRDRACPWAINQALEDARRLGKRLGMRDDSELVRFVILQLECSDAALRDPATVEALTGILEQTKTPFEKRLDLVERLLASSTSNE
jgi:hypothetical protein